MNSCVAAHCAGSHGNIQIYVVLNLFCNKLTNHRSCRIAADCLNAAPLHSNAKSVLNRAYILVPQNDKPWRWGPPLNTKCLWWSNLILSFLCLLYSSTIYGIKSETKKQKTILIIQTEIHMIKPVCYMYEYNQILSLLQGITVSPIFYLIIIPLFSTKV